MNERDGSSCLSHNKRRVLKINLDFNVLKNEACHVAIKICAKLNHRQVYKETNAGFFSERYFHISYLWIPTGVQFFHCSNILLHGLMRAGVSQGFPSLPKRENKTSASRSETAQCFFIVSLVEPSEQLILSTFRVCKPTFHSV